MNYLKNLNNITYDLDEILQLDLIKNSDSSFSKVIKDSLQYEVTLLGINITKLINETFHDTTQSDGGENLNLIKILSFDNFFKDDLSSNFSFQELFIFKLNNVYSGDYLLKLKINKFKDFVISYQKEYDELLKTNSEISSDEFWDIDNKIEIFNNSLLDALEELRSLNSSINKHYEINQNILANATNLIKKLTSGLSFFNFGIVYDEYSKINNMITDHSPSIAKLIENYQEILEEPNIITRNILIKQYLTDDSVIKSDMNDLFNELEDVHKIYIYE